ncbi:MAG: hypothetical protein SGCHY_005436 [Lobulomycetales sp.]
MADMSMIEDEEMGDAVASAAASASKRKGRGFTSQTKRNEAKGKFESVPGSNTRSYQKSVEGWIILVTGIHEEASEEDVSEVFADFGQIVNIHLNLNRRTGFVKGYALLEYADFESAQEAVKTADGSQLLGKTIHVDFCFIKPPSGGSGGPRR